MLASSYPRFPGDGAGTFVASLAEGLATLGHQVAVVAPADPLATVATPGPVRVTRFGYSPWQGLQPMGYGKGLHNDQRLRRSTYLLALPYLLSGARRVAQTVVQEACDLIHGHWVLPNGPVAALAARLTGRPLVITLHGSDTYVAKGSLLLGLLARWSFRQAGAVTACSPDLAEDARRLGARPQDVQLIPWGADPDRFGCGDGGVWRARLGIGPERPVVAAAGRLVEKKGFHVLLEAFQQAHAALPGAILALGGQGPLSSELAAQAERLGLSRAVRLCGHIPWPEMPDFLAMADVVAVPAVRDRRGNLDGLPTVALEAMAASKPVVASRLAGLPLVVEHGVSGLLTPPEEACALAEALLALLRDPARARCYGDAARARVERELNWAAVARRYQSVYQKALERRPEPAEGDQPCGS